MVSPGAAARRRGHDFERDCARYLTGQLGIRVVTSRSLSGGTQAGGDLASYDPDLCLHVHGWTLECKAWTASAVPTWIRQARAAADGSGLYAVIQKRPRKPVRESRVWMPWDVLERWTRRTVRSEAEYASIPLSEYADLLKGAA
jgi:hypothetical protein